MPNKKRTPTLDDLQTSNKSELLAVIYELRQLVAEQKKQLRKQRREYLKLQRSKIMFNYSEYDQMELGCSPNGEDCVQVSRDVDYIPAMKAEVKRYKEMLQKRFPDWELYDCNFKIQANPHEFGTYYEVAIRYNTNNEPSVQFALFVEGNCPELWSDDKVLRFVPTADGEKQEKCPACGSTDVIRNQCMACGEDFYISSSTSRRSHLNDFKVTYDDDTSYNTSANGTLEEFKAYLMQDGGVFVDENLVTGEETRRTIVNVEWLPKTLQNQGASK